MSHRHHRREPIEKADTGHDPVHSWTWFFVIVMVLMLVEVWALERYHHNRPQVSVVADEAPVVKQEDRAPASVPPVVEVPAPELQQSEPETSQTVETAPDTSDLRPSVDTPVAAPVAPVDAPADNIEPPAADVALPTATAADEAQYAHDLPLRRHHHHHRPHHHHRHQRRRHAFVGAGRERDFAAAFLRDTARLAGLIQ